MPGVRRRESDSGQDAGGEERVQAWRESTPEPGFEPRAEPRLEAALEARLQVRVQRGPGLTSETRSQASFEATAQG